MKGSIYLIGGGEIRKGETAQIDDELKKNVDKDSNLVFFPRASGDSLDYIKAMELTFGDQLNVIAPTLDDGIEYSISAIDSASIIYLGGGDADLLLELFNQWQLVERLESAINRGVHVVGMSAGAQALSAWYIREHDGLMELRRGWGFVPACVLVHANENSVARAKEIWERSPDARSVTFVAIGEGAGWCVRNNDVKKVGNGKIWKKIDGESSLS